VLPYTRFCNCFLDYCYVLHIVNFAIRHLIPRVLSPTGSISWNPASTKLNVCERLSDYLWKVGGLFPNTLYNVSGFSRPSIKTGHHHINEKLLSMAKNSKQTKKHLHSHEHVFISSLIFKDIIHIASLNRSILLLPTNIDPHVHASLFHSSLLLLFSIGG
jgi:hypothetical protein